MQLLSALLLRLLLLELLKGSYGGFVGPLPLPLLGLFAAAADVAVAVAVAVGTGQIVRNCNKALLQAQETLGRLSRSSGSSSSSSKIAAAAASVAAVTVKLAVEEACPCSSCC